MFLYGCDASSYNVGDSRTCTSSPIPVRHSAAEVLTAGSPAEVRRVTTTTTTTKVRRTVVVC